MWKRFVGKYWDQSKEILGRLTPSQRLTAAVLALTVFLGLLILAFFTGRGSYVALARHRNLTELQAMAAQLREAGYSVRVREGTLEVKESQLPRALSYVAGEVASTPRRDGWAWLDKEAGWGETSVRQAQKARRARTINLEESIKVCPDIADALVVLNIKDTPFTVLDAGESENSASVTVTLAPGVGRLKPGQVRVIRNIVSGGAPVPFRNVKVTDNRLNMYPVEEEELDGFGTFDERRQAQIKDYRKRIAAYLEQTFRSAEYSLFVDVKLTRERVESDAEMIVDPPKKGIVTSETVEKQKSTRRIGGESPGTKTNVSARLLGPGESAPETPSSALRTVDTEEKETSKREYTLLVSRKHDRVKKPAGSIEKISVAVRLDKEAVERVVSKLRGIDLEAKKKSDNSKERSELETAVEDYLRESEKEIEQMLSIHGPVNVSVRPDILLAGTMEIETARNAGGTLFNWARENAFLLVFLFLGLISLGFVYTLARRAIPPPIEIPSVDLPEGGDVVVEEAKAEEEEPQEESIPELQLEDDEFAGTLAQAESVGRERPGVAAAVVKLWIGECKDKPGR